MTGILVGFLIDRRACGVQFFGGGFFVVDPRRAMSAHVISAQFTTIPVREGGCPSVLGTVIVPERRIASPSGKYAYSR